MALKTSPKAILDAAQDAGLVSGVMPLADISPAFTAQSTDASEALENVQSKTRRKISLLAAAETLETLSDQPKNAELAEAVSQGIPLSLIEAGLKHEDGFSAFSDTLREEALSCTTSTSLHLTDQTDVETIKSLRQKGLNVLIGDLPFEPSDDAIAIDLSRFVTSDGLDARIIAEIIDAAKSLQANRLHVIPCGLSAAIMALGKPYETKSVVDICRTLNQPWLITPLSAQALIDFIPTTQGLMPFSQSALQNSDGHWALTTPIKLGLARTVPESLTALQKALEHP
ncbi:MAG: hypothetical protein AAF296_09610, partial [Pseudomonadota bacterium]